MLVTGVTISPSNYLLPQFSAAVNFAAPSLSSATPCLSFATNLVEKSNTLRTGRFDFSASKKRSKVCTYVLESNWASASATFRGVWEDPHDGSDSDYDEEDEEGEENDMDYESDWEEQTNTSTTSTVDNSTENNYEEDLLKEVEQLLGLEERAILQQNATYNLDKISTAKWKPLQTLALSGQIHSMDKLLEDGLSIDSMDKDGLTALHKAIIGKKESVISHLLRKGASPHIRDPDGASPLHYAVQVGAMQTVKLLIKYNVDVNVADNEGWTALHVAVQSRNRDIVKVLLVNGADKNRRNKVGMTPLDLCLCYGKDFKSYDLAKLVKIVPVNRDL